MDHQESLHNKFLNVMELRDKERIGQEEVWREQESGRARRESVARAHDRELAVAQSFIIVISKNIKILYSTKQFFNETTTIGINNGKNEFLAVRNLDHTVKKWLIVCECEECKSLWNSVVSMRG
ncbi:Trihelix transcription factor GT-2 [Dendrobium catenatum]|uniref:Trihelix transcription factor GT-2 n=1 Tax=Dendrobium catenatum TaxID=906689 RepID=A0A2I0WBV9_9ASPA|nr:Trihelix transcription factor GT-2 [Dendrobium catenatum]